MSSGNFRGGNVKAAKLSWAQVHSIRAKYEQGWTQGALAREFKMGVAQIGRIVRHECWIEGVEKAIPHEAPPTDNAWLENLAREQEVRKEFEGEAPARVSGAEIALQAVKKRAGGFGQVVDFDEPGRELAPGDYSDPTGRRG